jgi:hypothetical protein
MLQPSCADRLKIGKPQNPETLGTCPDWYRDSFAFIGAFEKLRKATISFVMYVPLSVRLSVRMEKLGSHWSDCREI